MLDLSTAAGFTSPRHDRTLLQVPERSFATVLAVTKWEVWRQDEGGVRERLSVHHDRIGALATVLALDTASVPGSSYWSAGPPGPACATNRDLYTRLVQVGNDMNATGRSLSEFLRSWWSVSRTVAAQTRLDLDTVAAMVTAAATIDPPALSPAWRAISYGPTPEPTSYVDWEQIVLSQIADLADLADAGPLDAYAYFGIDIRRPTDAVRATGSRWYNFDPRGYLECGMAGSLGGWDEADGLRVTVPGPVICNTPEPEPGERLLNTLSWADIANLAICGQAYE